MSKIVLALRLSRGHAVDLALDPTGSGLIGLPNSEVTSSHGTLFDKQASILPATADKILECLISAGVGERSRVAVCLTGSFPGANIALGACLAALKAEPTIIASAASSSYGANIPDLLWLDMEQAIPRAVLPHRPCAASIGGNNDLGANTERPDILREAIEAAKLPIVEGMDARMRIFDEHLAQGERYALFVNVGGGSAAIGGTAGKSFPLGLWRVDATMEGFDCISLRMHRRGTPVLNLRGIAQFLRGETYLRLPSSEGQ